jgi:hypothetical protein
MECLAVSATYMTDHFSYINKLAPPLIFTMKTGGVLYEVGPENY